MKKVFNPKKGKLIAEAGFYSIIERSGDEWPYKYVIPLYRKISLYSIVTNSLDISVIFQVTFELQKLTSRYAIYQQVDCVSVK